MRYRQLSGGGDYTVGLPYYANSPQVVAQAVSTRLKLLQGEWFLDTSDGTPFFQSILGRQFQGNPDAYIKQRILNTPGVSSIVSYLSTLVGSTRQFTVSVTIETLYSVGGVSTATVVVG